MQACAAGRHRGGSFHLDSRRPPAHLGKCGGAHAARDWLAAPACMPCAYLVHAPAASESNKAQIPLSSHPTAEMNVALFSVVVVGMP